MGLALSLQAIEPAVLEAAGDVTPCDEPPAAPALPRPAATSLVVHAEGQGVPMVQPPTEGPAGRLAKGQKCTKQQDAIGTALSAVSPYPRTPQEVVAGRLQDSSRPALATRPQPVGKDLRATLAGKAEAMRCLAPRGAQRAGPPIQQRVALTDGAEARQQQMVTHVPEHPLVRDIIHATAYLWETANARRGEPPPPRLAGVGAYLEPLLAGQTDAVITALEAAGKDPTPTVRQRQAVPRTVGDSRRNRPYMRYDAYLACGWPIGTGVVEGACGHLVNDRREPAGRRGTPGGAQAVLDLRAVRLNGHWETSWLCHRQPQHHRLSGRNGSAPALAEAQALAWAA